MNKIEEIAAVTREARRLLEQGGTDAERAALEERKRAVLDQLEEDK